MTRFYANMGIVNKLLNQYLEDDPNKKLNPDQVYQMMQDILPGRPITSGSMEGLRRISAQNLTTVGALVKYLRELNDDY